MPKYKIYVLFLFILFIFTYIKVEAIKQDLYLPLLGKVIYLDPGHGGKDPGTIYKNIYEKDINLDLCLKLEKILEKYGAIVYLTRYGDYDLSNPKILERKKSDLNNRAKIINDSTADMYISIHLNSIASKLWSGAQVFYDDVNNKNYELAKLMQNRLAKDLKTKRQVKEIKTMLMNRKIKIPGILIEAGFLSNSNDRYLLQQEEYQYKVVNSISEAIIDYFN